MASSDTSRGVEGAQYLEDLANFPTKTYNSTRDGKASNVANRHVGYITKTRKQPISQPKSDLSRRAPNPILTLKTQDASSKPNP
ncbi:hypothetical protein BELL_0675g00020 [Botrytis elliptica]|uniref:Uncharacterized protein n=1 Tax=Botrytis elliptica TaxID=278938 RepID=A0A4Z1JAU1_9HELO|nr:hypothetical protein BELL_0675g00020 [Botrytis elliptica]